MSTYKEELDGGWYDPGYDPSDNIYEIVYKKSGKKYKIYDEYDLAKFLKSRIEDFGDSFCLGGKLYEIKVCNQIDFDKFIVNHIRS